MDRDDVLQAIEIACGDDIGREISSRRTASQSAMNRLRAGLERFLRELPPETMVHEILEAIDDRSSG